MAVSSEWPQFKNDVPYSDSSTLNTLNICLPRPPSNDNTRIWIIYIHGGAWQDPAITATSFTATQNKLLSSPAAEKIAGYATLNYRLSPYPSHPTDPSNPADPARNAKHPDHINDVLAALLYLQDRYGFEERYILVGHSCGATLAFQTAMRRYWGSQYESTPALELNVVPPVAIVGLEGLYDLPALVRYHREQPEYRAFVANAFGDEIEGWEVVSPTSGGFGESWVEGRVVVLAHSAGDSLVEGEQPELMRAALEALGWGEKGERRVLMFELYGDHDEVWETGDAGRAVEFAVGEVLG